MVKANSKEGKLIGEITHYFGKIGVGVIKLKGSLKIGDTIRIVGGEDTDFEQEVQSMEMEYKKIKTAKAKQSIGLELKDKAREGYKVYKI